jgi:hypothetical protein
MVNTGKRGDLTTPCSGWCTDRGLLPDAHLLSRLEHRLMQRAAWAENPEHDAAHQYKHYAEPTNKPFRLTASKKRVK